MCTKHFLRGRHCPHMIFSNRMLSTTRGMEVCLGWRVWAEPQWPPQGSDRAGCQTRTWQTPVASARKPGTRPQPASPSPHHSLACLQQYSIWSILRDACTSHLEAQDRVCRNGSALLFTGQENSLACALGRGGTPPSMTACAGGSDRSLRD